MEFLIVIVLFATVFPMFWIGVITLIAYIGGWQRLAKHYKTAEQTPQDAWTWQSAILGSSARYNGVLTIAIDKNRIFLKTFWMFGFSHPALSIPWSDIEVSESTYFFMPVYVLKVGNPRIGTIMLYQRQFPNLGNFKQ